MRFPSRTGLPGALAVAVVVVASVPSYAAAAGAGGTSAPAAGSAPATPAPTAPAPTGGTAPGSATPHDERRPPKGKRRKRSGARPVIVVFHANARSFYDLGRPTRVVFRI